MNHKVIKQEEWKKKIINFEINRMSKDVTVELFHYIFTRGCQVKHKGIINSIDKSYKTC